MLTGTEIKSIRLGKASLVDTFCYINNGELWVKGMNISPISMARMPTTRRAATASYCSTSARYATDGRYQAPGFTIVPILIFIDSHGRAKVDIALARGKKEYDKRQSLKEKEDRREMDRAIKHF